jgi:hypothetical protein
VRDGKELAETVHHIGFRKSVWQDIWRSRRRTAIVFCAAVTTLLRSAPTARTYELLTILLVVASTVFPVIYLMWPSPTPNVLTLVRSHWMQACFSSTMLMAQASYGLQS